VSDVKMGVVVPVPGSLSQLKRAIVQQGGSLEDALAAPALAQRYADALIAIVGQPWPSDTVMVGGVPRDRRYCKWCWAGRGAADHTEHCPWLIAARALGVA